MLRCCSDCCHRPLVQFDRFRVIIQLFVSRIRSLFQAAEFVVDIQGRVEVLDRGLVFAGSHQTLAAGLIRRARERVTINRIVEIGDRLNVIALTLIDQAARMIGLRAFRIQADRLVEVVERAGDSRRACARDSAAEIRGRVVRIDSIP